MMTSQEEFDIVEKYIKSRSSKVRKSGNGIVFNCFYHDDSNPSASWKMGRNKPLGYCAVCGSIYHRLREDAGIQKEKTGGEEFTPFEKFLYYNMKDEYKIYDFVTEKYLCSHFRMKNKEKHGFPRGVRNGDHITKGTDNIDTTYAVFCDDYLKNIKETINNGGLICYAEGEKDARTLNQNGFLAFTCGGINTFKKDLLPYLKGGKFVVFGDNDEVGKKDAEQITSLLNTVGEAIMVVPTPDIEKGDVSDYLRIHAKEDLQKLIDSVMSKSVKETVRNDSSKSGAKPIDLMQFHLIADNGKIIGVYHNAIFEYIKANYDLFVVGGTPYIYDCGYYKADTTGARLKTLIRGLILPQFIKSITINNIYALFLQDANLETEFSELNCYPSYWICFKNGMWDCKEKRMLPHSPKYKAINQIPHEYHPEKKQDGEKIEEYLNFICDGKLDTREMLLQFMGYSLAKDTGQQKFLILLGEGGSGKSTLIKCFEMLVGQRNISNVSLTDLQERFSSVELMGMLVNSCADLEIGALTDTSAIKKLVGEDSIKGEKKGKDLVFFKNYAKLIFSTNELPMIKSEKTNAFYRRLLVLPMNKVSKRKDPDLFSKLVTEKDYLLMLAVQALERMYQQGTITIAAISEYEIERLRADSDTVEGFILEECEKADEYRMERTELYKRYSAFCEENERQALTKNNFYKSLRLKNYMEITSNGKRYFLGLKFALKNCTNDGFMTVTQEQLENLPFE